MSYADILAQRGYRRIVVERTSKQPGDLVLESRACVRVPVETTVTQIRKGRRG